MREDTRNDRRTLTVKASSTQAEILAHMQRYQIIIGLPAERIRLVDNNGKVAYRSPVAYILPDMQDMQNA